MSIKRIFLLVLDSFGIGAAADAACFGDEGANTLASIAKSSAYHAPTLARLGLDRITEAATGEAELLPIGAYGRMQERAAGKDTVIGHWEIAGYAADRPLPTYPNGFPDELVAEIEEATGIGAICNKPYSGTEVLRDYGEEMMQSGKVILYTSADSVFQVAAHEDVIPLSRLYAYCEKARALLRGEHAVGRVIARPFVGKDPDSFARTPHRHDYALDVPGTTMADLLTAAGKSVIGVGKIGDIFNRRGITQSYPCGSNAEGMEITARIAEQEFEGLCFVNLVDFDMKFGHRRDVDGYARAISAFDKWLASFLPSLGEEDMVMLTADHGCDPAFHGTDHTRENVPILVAGKQICACDLGLRESFGDVAKTICALLGVDAEELAGESFADRLLGSVKEDALLAQAKRVMQRAYSPYSHFRVGAALLGKSGRIYTGCNIENAAFSPTICAERAAIAQAISQGEREFSAIAVVGGKNGEPIDMTTPCGVCRQVLSEFCKPDFPILMQNRQGESKRITLGELLPHSFGASSFIE